LISQVVWESGAGRFRLRFSLLVYRSLGPQNPGCGLLVVIVTGFTWRRFVISEMGFLVDSQEGSGKGGGSYGGVRSLIRRKQVDSVRVKRRGQQLAKELSVLHLIAIGKVFALFFPHILNLF
jgi:hypothetical protein